MEWIHARARRDMKNRVAAVLLLTGAVLTSLGWNGEAWGQAKPARVGILRFLSHTDDQRQKYWLDLFRRNLADQGWIEGKNVSFEYRSPLGDPSQFGTAAAQLVGLKASRLWPHCLIAPLPQCLSARRPTAMLVVSTGPKQEKQNEAT